MSAGGRRVLVVGGGGREHALAWALQRSPRCTHLIVAPGNGDTPGLRRPVAADDVAGLVDLAAGEGIDLVVVGPEAALAAGLADALADKGIACFGPTRAAAELEWSKAFARGFCERHAIASPRFAVFRHVPAALDHLRAVDYPVVIKASGLASGKGVVLPADRSEAAAAVRAMLEGDRFGAAGREVVIEERLAGDEVSLLTFVDDSAIVAMPPAQDHKRIFEGDRGPNTGGMGAYAPAPACPPALVDELIKQVFEPVVRGMRAEGRPYRGVLYAGLMLTRHGPRVLEFNCRFGDPETQAIVALLETDLLDVLEAVAHDRLASVAERVTWRPRSAVAVVMAAPGYPAHPRIGDAVVDAAAGGPPAGAGESDGEAFVFHAGTDRLADGTLVSAGGRVLSVTGVGPALADARQAAYARLSAISLDGSQVRRDIGWRAVAATTGGYAASGVDIDAGNDAVSGLRASVESTHDDRVLAGVGAFGGALSLSFLRSFEHPVLVASTDGVGTKVELAARAGRVRGVGVDIVNHCINDVLVQNARPVAFLDYFAAARLDPAVVAEVVEGMAEACRAAGCVLLGGETAEMPGVYAAGAFDVAGTLLGVAERARLLPRVESMAAGDVLVGIGSSGPHTNGYSLLRRIFAALPLDSVPPPLERSLGDALLEPHRSYLEVLAPLLDADPSPIKGLAHVTGGGLIENVPRVLPQHLGAEVTLGSWPLPPLFALVADVSKLGPGELYRSLNMGIGMVAVVAQDDAVAVAHATDGWPIGTLVPRAPGPRLRLLDPSTG